MNAHAQLTQTFSSEPQRIRLQSGTLRLSAADIEAQSARCASTLAALGLSPGDRVMAQLEDSAQAVMLYLGALRAGCVFVPLPMAWPDEHLPYFVGDAEPKLILCTRSRHAVFEALARQLPHPASVSNLDAVVQGCGAPPEAPAATMAVAPDPGPAGNGPALILYTAGTSGQPHGALVSHERLASDAAAITERWNLSSQDTLVAALPLFSMPGLCIALHAALACGACVKLVPQPRAEDLAGASVLLGTPQVYERLLSDPAPDPQHVQSIRLFASACGALRRETAQAFAARSGLAPRQCYGSAETGLVTADFTDARFRIGTVGKVLSGRRLRIVGSNLKPMPLEHLGEIQLPGFEGWWRRPAGEGCTTDGWFPTGDIGMYDEEDYISVCGRTGNRFVSGYYTIDPDVIECVLETLPGVADSVVIDVPHPELRTQAVALVVPAAGHRLTGEAILSALRDKLPHHLVPARVFFLDSLPRNPLGRVQRQPLRDRFGAAGQADPIGTGRPGRTLQA